MTMLTATPTSTLQTIVNVKVRNMSARSIHARILRSNAGLSVPSVSRTIRLTSSSIPGHPEPQP